MEQQYTRALLVDTRADEATGSRVYTFRASTTAPARDGFVIPAAEWRLDNFLRNPVVLISHDYNSLPIGRAVSITSDEDGLLASVEYDAGDPRAQDVMRKLDGGYMSAVSVGFRPGDATRGQRGEPGTFTDVELLEISNVAVPSDPGALMLRDAWGSPPESDTDLHETIRTLTARVAAVEAALAVGPPADETPEDVPVAEASVEIDLSALTALRSLSHGIA